MIFGAKKIDVNRVEDNSRQDLALITQMNQELAGSLDLKETLQNASVSMPKSFLSELLGNVARSLW